MFDCRNTIFVIFLQLFLFLLQLECKAIMESMIWYKIIHYLLDSRKGHYLQIWCNFYTSLKSSIVAQFLNYVVFNIYVNSSILFFWNGDVCYIHTSILDIIMLVNCAVSLLSNLLIMNINFKEWISQITKYC